MNVAGVSGLASESGRKNPTGFGFEPSRLPSYVTDFSGRRPIPIAAHVLAPPYLRRFIWIEGRTITPAPRTPRFFANYAIVSI
jgi:hypothetical protein